MTKTAYERTGGTQNVTAPEIIATCSSEIDPNLCRAPAPGAKRLAPSPRTSPIPRRNSRGHHQTHSAARSGSSPARSFGWQRLALRRRLGLHEIAGAVLDHQVRLAQSGSQSESLSAVHRPH